MFRAVALLISAVFVLSACATGPVDPPLGADGKPLPRLYRIANRDTSKIQFRMLDAVNALRQAGGAAPVVLNPELNAAAATHAQDMALQNRPWHFGSDGSSPLDRVARVGYQGQLVGETISETYESELETLGAWMETAGTRDVLLDASANDMGFAWFQEANGKIWWTLVMGSSTSLEPGAEVTAEL